MHSAQTNITGRIGGVEWIRTDDHGFTIRSLRGERTVFFSEVAGVHTFLERNTNRRLRKNPGEYDRRLSDGLFYAVIALLVLTVLLGPVGFLSSLAVGIGIIFIDARGVIAIDLLYLDGTTKTIRIWDSSPEVASVAQQFERAAGGTEKLRSR